MVLRANGTRSTGEPGVGGRYTAAALIERAIAKVPTLTYFGVGIYKRPASEAAASEAIAAGQAKLRAAVHEVEQCVAWLSGVRAVRTIQRFPSSYTFKHSVEGWLRRQGRPAYIANGAFVAAAVGTGRYPFAIQEPNVCFGFSSKDLRRARQRSAAAAATV